MAAAPQLAPIPGFSASYPLRTAASASPFGGHARRRPLRATDDASTDRPVVLVVEPDERTRSLLLAGLARNGFEVTAAASAEEALRFLSPDRPLPGIVFAEADLRGGDGFSLCQQIRADQRTADLPVVLLSRAPEAWHRELAGGAGADQYLPKPLFLNDVVALARLMAGRSSSDARFEADTAALPIAHALRALLSGVRAGRIELTAARAWISFRDGRVVDCAFDGERGDDALKRMLLLGAGAYVVTFGPGLARATMSFDLEALVRKVLPRLSRWQKLVERSVPLEAVLVVDFGRLKDAIETLPDEVNGVLRLFDGRRSVRQVVTESTLDEVMALEVVTRLYAMGLVAAAEQDGEAPEVVRVPAFFEPTVPAVTPVSTPAPQDVVSLFEATGTLEPELLRQLEAFRIKTVVEPREVAREDEATSEPSVAEVEAAINAALAANGSLEASTETSAETVDAIDAAINASLAAEPTAEALDALQSSETASPELASFVREEEPLEVTPSITATVEDAFFADEAQALADDLAVEPAPAQPKARWMIGAAAGVALIAVVAVVAVIGRPSTATSSGATSATPPAPAAEPVKVQPAPATIDAKPVAPVEPAFVEVELKDGDQAIDAATKLYEARRLKDAIALLDEVTQADPTRAQAWLLLGLAKYDRGDTAGAERSAMRTLAVDPQNGRALVLLASVYLEQGHEQEAKVELKRYLQLYPHGPFAREARQLLAQ